RPVLLYVTRRPPFPLTNGGRIRAHRLLVGLSTVFDTTLLTFEHHARSEDGSCGACWAAAPGSSAGIGFPRWGVRSPEYVAKCRTDGVSSPISTISPSRNSLPSATHSTCTRRTTSSTASSRVRPERPQVSAGHSRVSSGQR